MDDSVLDHLPLAVLVVDSNGVIQQLNRAAAELAGRLDDEAEGQRAGNALRCVQAHEDPRGCGFGPACEHCALRRQVTETVRDRVARRQQPATLVQQALGGEDERHLLVSTSPMDSGGRILVCLEDVTYLRETETRLQQAQKLETVGQLAGGVAHDFNNQLTGIIGFAESLRRHLKDQPKLQRYADLIERTAQQSAEITGKLLTFARKGSQRMQRIDLHAVMQDALALLQHGLPRGIDLEHDYGAGKSVVVGDPAQLQNALLNLGINAKDALPEGGTIRYRTRVVELAGEQIRQLTPPVGAGPYLEIAVSDNGEGIPPEIQDRVFDPFFTSKKPGNGTGMGLAMVYGTVSRHRGGIALQSSPGHGTTIRIYLPLISEEASAPPHGEGCDGIVIFADSDRERRSQLEGLLQRLGRSCLPCEDSACAIRRYRQFHAEVDTILLAGDLSGPDAACAAAALRGIDSAVRVVCIGSPGAPASLPDVADVLLPWPVDVRALGEAIDPHACATE
jgi:signal transduction histidine kinase